MSSEQLDDRDGFVVKEIGGDEVGFVACSDSGRPRETALSGLLRNMDTDRYCVEDTRWEAPNEQ